MATDTENLLAERFREIRQEWDLRPGVETKAQNEALAPLRAWLHTGVDAPEVVIRAVQVLMANPERPGIHKRPAVNYVFKQISKFWESAGFTEQDVLVLKGMLLACWTDDLNGGHFALTPLLDSAWTAIERRLGREKYLEQWRHQQISTPSAIHSKVPQNATSVEAHPDWSPQLIDVADAAQEIAQIKANNEDYTATLAKRSAALFSSHHGLLTEFSAQINQINQFLTQLNSNGSEVSRTVSQVLSKSTSSQVNQSDLLWWGQARYSSTKRQSYRRISDAPERLWWMAWESSKLAMGLEVEPAASFLVENLYQLDNQTVDQKRPLKEWLAALISTLRRIREDEQLTTAIAMSTPLEKLAREDALGLPVTWARLQAAKPRPDTGAIEDRLREDVAIDPDTLIDLGDWAAWVFRESLLDRHLGAR